MAIRIITDTSSDFTTEELHRRNITVVPMKITIGDQEYVDGVDLTRADFYDILTTSEEFPKTSQPSPEDFRLVFEEIKADGDEAIVILLSGALSGTVQSAVTAKEMVEYDGIHVVDSRSATAGIQFLVDEAQRLAGEGIPAAEIAARLESLKGRIRIFAGVDTLKYLYKGGRLTRIEAGVGTLVNIRPIITVTQEGTVATAAKCMGSKKALRRLAELISEVKADPAYPIRYVYSCDTANCRALMELLNETSADTVPMIEVGSTLGAHTGPNVYGAVFIAAED